MKPYKECRPSSKNRNHWEHFFNTANFIPKTLLNRKFYTYVDSSTVSFDGISIPTIHSDFHIKNHEFPFMSTDFSQILVVDICKASIVIHIVYVYFSMLYIIKHK